MEPFRSMGYSIYSIPHINQLNSCECYLSYALCLFFSFSLFLSAHLPCHSLSHARYPENLVLVFVCVYEREYTGQSLVFFSAFLNELSKECSKNFTSNFRSQCVLLCTIQFGYRAFLALAVRSFLLSFSLSLCRLSHLLHDHTRTVRSTNFIHEIHELNTALVQTKLEQDRTQLLLQFFVVFSSLELTLWKND